MIPEDEAETPEVGIAVIRKLLEQDKVDVLIGGQTSGVTVAQLPHIAPAKVIYLGVGAASPLITDEFVRGELKLARIAILGENLVWVQGVLPALERRLAEKRGLEVVY